MVIEEYPPMLTRSQAAELTGLSAKYLDKLRLNNAVRVYTLVGGSQHRFYRDELLEHVGLKENRNGEL